MKVRVFKVIISVFEKKTQLLNMRVENETRLGKRWNLASLWQVNLVLCTKS